MQLYQWVDNLSMGGKIIVGIHSLIKSLIMFVLNLILIITNHPWVRGIQVCSKEGHIPSPNY
jgi:hypothetical protein